MCKCIECGERVDWVPRPRGLWTWRRGNLALHVPFEGACVTVRIDGARTIHEVTEEAASAAFEAALAAHDRACDDAVSPE